VAAWGLRSPVSQPSAAKAETVSATVVTAPSCAPGHQCVPIFGTGLMSDSVSTWRVSAAWRVGASGPARISPVGAARRGEGLPGCVSARRRRC
jgi:hypothetical protein